MTGCLYEVLGLGKDASQDDIKKAYRQRALQLHPDKNPGNEDAKAKFQLLQKVYAILGDEEKRKVYDQTGSTDDDELAGAGFDGLVDYFRAMFGIKTEDIDDFTARYQGSADERADLLRYYNQFRGNMTTVFDHLMCSDPELDSHRLRDVLEGAIEAGEAQRYKPYTAWAKAVAARPRPPARRRSAGAAGPTNALIAAIQTKRAAVADSFFESLAAKYGGGKEKGKEKGNGGKVTAGVAQVKVAEPTDSEFEAARRRLEGRNAFKSSGATSKQRGRRKDKAQAAGGGKKKGQRSRPSAAASDSDDDEEDGLPALEELGGDDGDEEAEVEEERGGPKRPAKKARHSGAGRASTGAADSGAAEQHRSAKKQKRTSGASGRADETAEEREDAGDAEQGQPAGGGSKRPLKAKPAAGQEAAACLPGERSAGKSSRSKDKNDTNARRGAEKENKATTPVAGQSKGENGKSKCMRMSGAGGDADGRGAIWHSSKKAKRAAA